MNFLLKKVNFKIKVKSNICKMYFRWNAECSNITQNGIIKCDNSCKHLTLNHVIM